MMKKQFRNSFLIFMFMICVILFLHCSKELGPNNWHGTWKDISNDMNSNEKYSLLKKENTFYIKLNTKPEQYIAELSFEKNKNLFYREVYMGSYSLIYTVKFINKNTLQMIFGADKSGKMIEEKSIFVRIK